MNNKLIVRKVTRWRFERKMRDLNFQLRNEIADFISFNEDLIDHFEYGRIPNHRVYRIVLSDESIREWKACKGY